VFLATRVGAEAARPGGMDAIHTQIPVRRVALFVPKKNNGHLNYRFEMAI